MEEPRTPPAPAPEPRSPEPPLPVPEPAPHDEPEATVDRAPVVTSPTAPACEVVVEPPRAPEPPPAPAPMPPRAPSPELASAGARGSLALNPDVAIVLVTRNDERTLANLLQRVGEQLFEGEREIIALDLGSTDRTVSLLEEASLRVLMRPGGLLRMAEVRDEAMAATRAPVVVFLRGDSLPQGERWLDALVRPLRDRRDVVFSYGLERLTGARDPVGVTWRRRPWITGGGPLHFADARQDGATHVPEGAFAVLRRAWSDTPFATAGDEAAWLGLCFARREAKAYVPEAMLQVEREPRFVDDARRALSGASAIGGGRVRRLAQAVRLAAGDLVELAQVPTAHNPETLARGVTLAGVSIVGAMRGTSK